MIGSVNSYCIPNFKKVSFSSKNEANDNIQNKGNSEKISLGKRLKGFYAGSLVQSLVASIGTPLGFACLNYMQNKGNGLSDAQFQTVKTATSKALNLTGLDKKGISIVRAGENNLNEVSDLIMKEINGGFVGKRLPKMVKDIAANIYSFMFNSGFNAAYAPNINKIIIPDGKVLSLSVFHEIGHAMNANYSKLGKILQKCRPLTALAVPIAFIALFKSPKKEGEKPQGFIDKTTTFVKNNAGKLTFMTFIPTLIEEGMASLKGNSLAKIVLSPDLATKVAKTNKVAYLTYLSAAVLAGLSIYAGKKVRDKICKPKTEKV